MVYNVKRNNYTKLRGFSNYNVKPDVKRTVSSRDE